MSDLSKKEKAIECIKAVSKIEGHMMSCDNLKGKDFFYDNIDYLVAYFDEMLKEMDK